MDMKCGKDNILGGMCYGEKRMGKYMNVCDIFSVRLMSLAVCGGRRPRYHPSFTSLSSPFSQ